MSRDTKTVLKTSSGRQVLVSYQTVVAVVFPDGTASKTSKFWSRTTNKHIKWFIGERPCSRRPQEEIERLAKGE